MRQLIPQVKKASARLSMVLALCVVVAGCGQSGLPRMPLRGDVTYNGEPVAAGQIRFEPDISRGGAGPVGFAAIVDGRYDTRSAGAKGPLAGPVSVIIEGYTSSEAFSPALFPRHTVPADLAADQTELNIDVPSARRTR